MTNEQIDVLAVMERARRDALWIRDDARHNNNEAEYEHWEKRRAELCKAHAAVSELIDAAAVFMRDEPAPSVNEMVDQYDRVRAALARVGGAE